MPGPQLTQAVAVCRRVKDALPHVPIVWGGYFPTQHADTVLRVAATSTSSIRSQGEQRAAATDRRRCRSGGIAEQRRPRSRGKRRDSIVHNPVRTADRRSTSCPSCHTTASTWSATSTPNYLGRRTVAHNSSFGCPFACSFCAVVAMSNRRWLAQSPARMERVLRHLVSDLRRRRRADARHGLLHLRSAHGGVRRAHRRARACAGGRSGRVDTLMQYSDATWRTMARSGLEDGVLRRRSPATDATLAAMNKGGKSSASADARSGAPDARATASSPSSRSSSARPPDPDG